jgi:RNA polymerase sigma-70 factor (ECF subfamily)
MMATPPDESTLASAANGDTVAFALLVRHHQAMVFSIAHHFLRNTALAEELAQDVFLHLHRSLRSIESPSHLTNWLRRTTTHRCVDQSRRQKLRPRLYLDQAPEAVDRSPERDPMLADRLRRLLAALPERARAVVILRYQEDLEPAEIAQALGIPVGTVKSSLHRALASLRARLERLAVAKGVSEHERV